MFEVLLESLPMSLGVALSPIPIAATLVLMLTPGAKANAPALLAGWVAGVLSVSLVVFWLPGFETAQGGPTPTSGYVRVALGIAMLVLAARQWIGRPGPGDEPPTPALIERLDQLTIRRSAATGFLLSALNPKNLLLVAGGANIIDTAMLTPAGQAGALIGFTLVASSTIAIPVVGHFLFQSDIEPLFARWKIWLIGNSAAVVAALLLVFGLLLTASGLSILLF
jgi:hypothetical protein